MKGGIFISTTGYIQVHAYTSYARIPLQYAAITVTDVSGDAIAMRLTNRSGMLDKQIPIEVPDASASQAPNTGVIPYSVVDLYARLENFEEIHIEKLQVFANTVTDLPENWNQAEIFETPPQNL